ncbi:hypothetical protein LTR84_003911 [Exophiala bonariae]|uniref:BZIP domain-containing protein n=1 Tax=Exophiala bonariae TaxID=1690606 RepID=A0AAV9N6F6_9EURO|nr:hypothetical protein LTR84_003911 [Exophiala bonariae]
MMFEVPKAKRIKRSTFLAGNSDENSSDGSRRSSRQVSPSQPEEEHQIVEVDYGFQYDFVTPQQQAAQDPIPASVAKPGNQENAEDQDQENEEPTYQFRLFNQPTTTSGSTSNPQSSQLPTQHHQAIRLSTTPEPGITEYSLESARFIRPRRPDTYHFTSALPPATQLQRQSQYLETAMSSHDVLSNATSKWPGTAVPWRVITITLPSTSTSTTKKSPFSRSSKTQATTSTPKALHPQPRPRPSKKRRIHLRRQLAAKAEAAQRATVTDAAEREKRTRRNREKKVKRKEREKRKKAEMGTTDGGGGAHSGSGTDSE